MHVALFFVGMPRTDLDRNTAVVSSDGIHLEVQGEDAEQQQAETSLGHNGGTVCL